MPTPTPSPTPTPKIVADLVENGSFVVGTLQSWTTSAPNFSVVDGGIDSDGKCLNVDVTTKDSSNISQTFSAANGLRLNTDYVLTYYTKGDGVTLASVIGTPSYSPTLTLESNVSARGNWTLNRFYFNSKDKTSVKIQLSRNVAIATSLLIDAVSLYPVGDPTEPAPFDTSVLLGAELIYNGDAEIPHPLYNNGADNWQSNGAINTSVPSPNQPAIATSGPGIDGSRAFNLSSSGVSGQNIYYPGQSQTNPHLFNLDGGKTYRFSCWLRIDSLGTTTTTLYSNFRLIGKLNGATASTFKTFSFDAPMTTTSRYEQYFFDLVIPAGSNYTGCYFSSYNGYSLNYAWMDNLSIKEIQGDVPTPTPTPTLTPEPTPEPTATPTPTPTAPPTPSVTDYQDNSGVIEIYDTQIDTTSTLISGRALSNYHFGQYVSGTVSLYVNNQIVDTGNFDSDTGCEFVFNVDLSQYQNGEIIKILGASTSQYFDQVNNIITNYTINYASAEIPIVFLATPSPRPDAVIHPVDSKIVVNGVPAGMKTTVSDAGDGFIVVSCILKGQMNVNSFSWAIKYDKTKVNPVTADLAKTDLGEVKINSAASVVPYFENAQTSLLAGYVLAAHEIDNSTNASNDNYFLLGYAKNGGNTIAISQNSELTVLKVYFRKLATIDQATFGYEYKAVPAVVVSKLVYSTTNILQTGTTSGSVYARPDLFTKSVLFPIYSLTVGCSSVKNLSNTGDAIYDAFINAAAATQVTLKSSYLSTQILASATISPSLKSKTFVDFANGDYVLGISRQGYLMRYIALSIVSENVNLGDKALIPGDVFVDGMVDGSDSEMLFAYIGLGYSDSNYLTMCDFNLDGIIDGTDTEMLFMSLGSTVNTYGENINYWG